MAAPKKSSKRSSTPIRGSYRKTTVSRWGNSLGLRIPREAAQQLKLRAGERVRVEIRSGTMTVTPMRKKWSETELLRGVTPDMVAGEVDWGPPVGKEIW
jgi:antitoxin MazE